MLRDEQACGERMQRKTLSKALGNRQTFWKDEVGKSALLVEDVRIFFLRALAVQRIHSDLRGNKRGVDTWIHVGVTIE